MIGKMEPMVMFQLNWSLRDHGGIDYLDFSNYQYIDATIIEQFIKR